MAHTTLTAAQLKFSISSLNFFLRSRGLLVRRQSEAESFIIINRLHGWLIDYVAQISFGQKSNIADSRKYNLLLQYVQKRKI